MDLCFSFSCATAEYIKTVLDHILRNSMEQLIQKGVAEMGFSHYVFIYCSKKASPLKLNEYFRISVSSMKIYSYKIFEQKLRSIKFHDYSNHTFVSSMSNT